MNHRIEGPRFPSWDRPPDRRQYAAWVVAGCAGAGLVLVLVLCAVAVKWLGGW